MQRGRNGWIGRGAVYDPCEESDPALKVGATPSGSSFGNLCPGTIAPFGVDSYRSTAFGE